LKVNIPLAEVFTTPTIRELSRHIKNRQEEVYASVEPAEKKDYYVLSSTQ
ncbi:MAG: hypothetical protein GTN53_44780, partial [Candidatus Aminicenantes bacterium]|nr:hypothetical protein [Candidatus Aminicenantes bacterium]NIQ73535.1 hypothetical protein [Candidatus Aminicenantes bacterium]NIT29624.1 hypothetical protein [Candidatus Aminicenantes bacterium]